MGQHPLPFSLNLGNRLVSRFPLVELLESRSSLILERCIGKEVLHLGCVEAGALESSFEDGSLLHLQLLRVAKRVVGLDIDAAGLAFLQARGIPDLVRFDAERLGELRVDARIEVIVAGEILEHLANPGLCLRGMLHLMTGADAIVIITVPNAFSLRAFLSVAVKRTELVMPDHTVYFSPTTVNELLQRCGLKVREFYTYSSLDKVRSPVKRLVKRSLNATIFKVNPFLAEGIIAIAGKV